MLYTLRARLIAVTSAVNGTLLYDRIRKVLRTDIDGIAVGRGGGTDWEFAALLAGSPAFRKATRASLKRVL